MVALLFLFLTLAAAKEAMDSTSSAEEFPDFVKASEAEGTLPVLGQDVCQLPADPGPCLRFSVRWYWDPKTEECHQFYYGGCLGNDNKFYAKKDCIKACIYKTDSPVIPDMCFLGNDPGYCLDERIGTWWWYFDADRGKCRQFYYYGCGGGNHNRFSSLYYCEKVCGARLSPKTVQCGKCDIRSSYCLQNSKFNYTCECRDGYEKNRLRECVDVDECKTGSAECDRHAWCINTEGSYRCSCMAGYKGDGKQCILVGLGRATMDCNSCHEHATCEQGICQCRVGYKGDGFNCEDVDECKRAQYPCAVQASCQNTPGSFRCRCPHGYAGNGYHCSKTARACLDKFDRDYKKECGGKQWEESYFFDHENKECRLFWYDGCSGRSRNMFSDLGTCEEMCERTQVMSRAEVCWDKFEKRYLDECEENRWEQRYYFNHESLTCTQFWYGQCLGTSRNTFLDLPSCQWLCEVQPMYLSRACLEPFDLHYKDQCSGGQWRLRYFFDQRERKCVGFWYDNCRSRSQNLFQDRRTCRYLCEAPAQAAAQRILKHKIHHGGKEEGGMTWSESTEAVANSSEVVDTNEVMIEIDPCSKEPCKNGGICKSNGGKDYVCDCKHGFTGSNCTQPPTNPCDSNPCQNGGSCQVTSTMSSFWCKCKRNFVGIYCTIEISIDPPTTTAVAIRKTRPPPQPIKSNEIPPVEKVSKPAAKPATEISVEVVDVKMKDGTAKPKTKAVPDEKKESKKDEEEETSKSSERRELMGDATPKTPYSSSSSSARLYSLLLLLICARLFL